MAGTLNIFQGDSSDTIQAIILSLGVQVTSLISNGYTATISITSSLGTTPVVTNVMTEVDDTFRGIFLPADTATLAPGVYIGIVQVINAGLSYKKEDQFNIVINTQGYEE